MPVVGLEPSVVATVAAVVPIGDEANISIATVERLWSFDGDGEAFKFAVEAKRIDLAFSLAR